MIATIILCILSTLSFCLCSRGLLYLAPFQRRLIINPSGRFSASAIRLGLGYLKLSLLILAVVSLVGVVKSFIELFQFSM